MRKIKVSNCEMGMILGKPIFYNSSTILLEKGTKLTVSYLERLHSLGITEIYVEDDISSGIVINDIVKEETRNEAVESINKLMDSVHGSVDMHSFTEIITIVNNIIDEILSQDEILVNLVDIKNYDSYTFSHCVNVCILAIATGYKIGLNYKQLQELGIGAILHDIGKVMIPSEILLKESELSDDEYNTIKQHSKLGYNILKDIPYVCEASARVALNHHERYDGNGYPNGLLKDEIHIYSRIVAIVDIYDALSSDRIYRKKICSTKALEYLSIIAAPSLDLKVLSYFLQLIPPYPVGTMVVLNTGEKGLVTKINEQLPTRPFIRIVFDRNGRKKFIFEETNLAEKLDYHIVSAEV